VSICASSTRSAAIKRVANAQERLADDLDVCVLHCQQVECDADRPVERVLDRDDRPAHVASAQRGDGLIDARQRDRLDRLLGRAGQQRPPSVNVPAGPRKPTRARVPDDISDRLLGGALGRRRLRPPTAPHARPPPPRATAPVRPRPAVTLLGVHTRLIAVVDARQHDARLFLVEQRDRQRTGGRTARCRRRSGPARGGRSCHASPLSTPRQTPVEPQRDVIDVRAQGFKGLLQTRRVCDEVPAGRRRRAPFAGHGACGACSPSAPHSKSTRRAPRRRRRSRRCPAFR